MENVYRFILLNPVFPRSILFPFLVLERWLLNIAELEPNARVRLSGPNRVLKKIQGTLLGLEETMPPVHEVEPFLQNLLLFCNQLGNEFTKSFFYQEDTMA